MQHWLLDRDLAGVRDRAALARLPKPERMEWQQLWREVVTLRQRALKRPEAAASSQG